MSLAHTLTGGLGIPRRNPPLVAGESARLTYATSCTVFEVDLDDGFFLYSVVVQQTHKPRTRGADQYRITWGVRRAGKHWSTWGCWRKTEDEAVAFANLKLRLARKWAGVQS